MNDRYASVHIDVDSSQATQRAAVEVLEEPFQVVLLGDFSARGSRSVQGAPAGPSAPIPVDRDDFDAVLARLAPRIHLTLDPEGPCIEIPIQDLDDFHPDGLYARAPIFARLRELRRRALDPAQLPQVAAELRGEAPAPPPSPTAAGSTAPVSGGALLDLVLEETAPTVEGGPSAEAVINSPGELARAIRSLVKQHLVPGPDPRQAQLLETIDAALADGMRRVLRHPDFQAAESLWRGLFLLVRRVETSRLLQLCIVDLTDDELRQAIASTAWTPGRPSLIVVHRSFSSGDADLELLRGLMQLGLRLRAPCLVAGDPELIGATDAEALAEPEDWVEPPAGWRELRADLAAGYLGVVMPRFLLRMPYGEDADECESFAFEELGENPTAAEYLWGNPALGAAVLLAQAFARDGWQMHPASHRELDALPLPLVRIDGELTVRHPAEAPIAQAAAQALLDLGVMPLVPVHDSNTVRLVRFQSVAEPLAPLAGRWIST